MKNEYDILCDMLANIIDSLNKEDFIDNEGYDRLSGCVASPVEVLAVMEIKMERLVKKIDSYEQALKLIDKNATSGHVRNIVKKALEGNF